MMSVFMGWILFAIKYGDQAAGGRVQRKETIPNEFEAK
jgi:hypothetical protein